MNRYEFVFITPDGDKKLLKTVEEIISNMEGKVTKKDDWGKKQLAYRIKDLTEAFYHLWDIELDGVKLKDLKNRLNLEDDIVRYLIIKQD